LPSKMVFARNYQTTKRKTMLVKTVLNRLERFKSFVFATVTFQEINGSDALVIEIKGSY